MQSKKKSGIVYKIIILILLLVIGFSLYKIGTIAYGYLQGRNAYDKIAEEAGAKPGKDNVRVKFDKLRKKYLKVQV